jgi:hypothetical protein
MSTLHVLTVMGLIVFCGVVLAHADLPKHEHGGSLCPGLGQWLAAGTLAALLMMLWLVPPAVASTLLGEAA